MQRASEWVSEWEGELVSEWVSEWVSQSVSQSISQSVSQWVSLWVSQSVSQWVSHLWFLCRRLLVNHLTYILQTWHTGPGYQELYWFWVTLTNGLKVKYIFLYNLQTVWPTIFIFGTGGQVSRLHEFNKVEWPWPNWVKVNLWQVISWERFDLKPSYLALGDKLASSISSIRLSDLDPIVQGQSLAGDISGTFWPTTSYLAQWDMLASPQVHLLLIDLWTISQPVPHMKVS